MNTPKLSPVIYTITNHINGKKYVGQSKDIKTRWLAHRNGLNAHRNHSSKLQRAWDKYGEESFEFKVVYVAQSFEELDALEKHYIAAYDSWTNGYNMTEGGELYGNNQIPCSWNGQEYPSKTEAAKAVGISKNAMNNRLQRDMSCDADTRATHRKCEWNGNAYSSLHEACRANNLLNVSTLFTWLAKGFTCDVDVPPQKIPCIWNGVSYGSIADAARACDITPKSMKRRLKRGRTCDADLKRKSKKELQTA